MLNLSVLHLLKYDLMAGIYIFVTNTKENYLESRDIPRKVPTSQPPSPIDCAVLGWQVMHNIA